jgi:hypothetical protein
MFETISWPGAVAAVLITAIAVTAIIWVLWMGNR